MKKVEVTSKYVNPFQVCEGQVWQKQRRNSYKRIMAITLKDNKWYAVCENYNSVEECLRRIPKSTSRVRLDRFSEKRFRLTPFGNITIIASLP